jgi:transcriptional regulator with XRE-family HTH domain
MNLTLMTDTEILEMLASKAREIRIANDLRQSDLSRKSGVPLSSIRVFERSGTISFVYLVKILRALSLIEELDGLFQTSEIVDLKTALKESKNVRKRVRK